MASAETPQQLPALAFDGAAEEKVVRKDEKTATVDGPSPERRKRGRNDDEIDSPSQSELPVFSVAKVPARTMVYAARTLEEKERLILPPNAHPLTGLDEFRVFRTVAAAKAAMKATGKKFRVLELQLTTSLRILSVMQQNPTPASLQQTKLDALQRDCDGYETDAATLIVFDPVEKTKLIDDDKRQDVTQKLITDMFSAMSLSAKPSQNK